MTKAYIHKSFTVPSQQYNWLQHYTAGWNEHTYIFFCHLLRSTIAQVRQYRAWIPISATLIKNHIWNTDLSILQDQELIQVKSHDRRLNRTREYKVNTEFFLEFFYQNPLTDLNESAIERFLNESKVNLFDGQKVKSFQKSILYDESRNPEPKLIVESIKAIRYSLYNQTGIIEHLQKLRMEYKEHLCNKNPSFEHKLFDFVLDFHCFESILNQEPQQTSQSSIYSFTPAYRVQSTGRIQAIGGMLQNCSKRMKIAAYSNIEKLKIFDIRTSHASIILSEMENAGIKCNWLKEYLTIPNRKYQFAEYIGIKYSTWKRCLYALLMNAPLRENLDSPVNSIRDYLALDVPNDELEKSFELFLSIIGSLKASVNEWYEYLVEDYIPKHQKTVVGKTFIKNAAGKTKQLKGAWSKGQIAAFLIQGYETAFIHHLTILSSKYNYIPLNNEHDALYVIGHIPKQAITEAKSATGLRYLQVVEKTIGI